MFLKLCSNRWQFAASLLKSSSLRVHFANSFTTLRGSYFLMAGKWLSRREAIYFIISMSVSMSLSTSGLWIFTATVLPSFNTALCTWLIEAEAIGFRSEEHTSELQSQFH